MYARTRPELILLQQIYLRDKNENRTPYERNGWHCCMVIQ
jgi:hypothetical protein